VNNIPSRATRSNTGVLMTLSPYTPAWGQAQSSAKQKRMFGRVFVVESLAAEAPGELIGSGSANKRTRRVGKLKNLCMSPCSAQARWSSSFS
jgi:hypothetical protein